MAIPELLERMTDELHAARRADEVIVSVSLTLPEWNHELARQLAPAFGERLRARGVHVRGLLMAIDRREKTGEWHWHGSALVRQQPTRKEAREAVSKAWEDVSCALPQCIKITTVSGWDAFVESGGDFEAMAGRRSFRTNWSTVVGYSFKAWPSEYGKRNLETDVFAMGSFAEIWKATRAAPASSGAELAQAEQMPTTDETPAPTPAASPSSAISPDEEARELILAALAKRGAMTMNELREVVQHIDLGGDLVLHVLVCVFRPDSITHFG